MSKYGYAPYCPKRDDRANRNIDKVEQIIKDIMDVNELILPTREQDRLYGIDRLLPNNDSIQLKNVEIWDVDELFSNTVTIPRKNYHDYVKHGVKYIFHSYYKSNDPSNVYKWVLITMDELQNHFDENRWKTKGNSGTDFYIWPYYEEYKNKKGYNISYKSGKEGKIIPGGILKYVVHKSPNL